MPDEPNGGDATAPAYTKPSYGSRERLAHRVLYYIHKRTSPDFPRWRDTTIRFFYELYELTNANPSLNFLFKRSDGMDIVSGPATSLIFNFTSDTF